MQCPVAIEIETKINFIKYQRKVMKTLLVILLFTISSAVTAQVAETTFENIEVTKQHNVLLLSINVPPRNTVSKAVLTEINTALNLAENDADIGAVVITGTNNVFSAGAGGESLKGVDKGEMTHAAIAHKVYNRIESFPKPVIAAISGISAGGGNELAMSCDIRIAGESAQFRQHELQAGLIPGFGGMQRLPRLVGQSRAMEIMLTGRYIGAVEALSIGLVTTVVPDSEVVLKAVSLAQQLNDNLDKKALAQFKKRMALSHSETFKEALVNDQLTFDELATSPDIHAAIATFIEKQKNGK